MKTAPPSPTPSAYLRLQTRLKSTPRTWLVTGAAGFIGSHLVETLLTLNQRVRGLDSLSGGTKRNLDDVRARVSATRWSQFQFIRGDVADLPACRRACDGTELVLHHAALVSVPLSIAEPLACHRSNVSGFLNLLRAARDAGAKRFVYASSSAVYGDDPTLPKVEDTTGRPLSPYAASKAMNETYAGLFARVYGLPCIGLRYFNVFGPRQDPAGGYAAVIPRWITALLQREPVEINGDGKTTRDFCFVADVVQANLLAATVRNPRALNKVYNIALGRRTSLNELFRCLQSILRRREPTLPASKPVYRDFRPGDIRHSWADIGRAKRLLGFAPQHDVEAALELAMDWYRNHLGKSRKI